MLHFDVIVRRVMAMSLERRNLFFPRQIAGNERWEVVRWEPNSMYKFLRTLETGIHPVWYYRIVVGLSLVRLVERVEVI